MLNRLDENLIIERECQAAGKFFIAGVDEAGRGPLFGPVVAASVIMPLEDGKIIEGITDSKKLTDKKRRELFERIKATAIDYKIIEVSSSEIDELNILNATLRGMKAAIEALTAKPDIVLIDGNIKAKTAFETKAIVKGDSKSYTIACASILAKVHRDNLIISLSEKYPVYNLQQNKGYGTKEHINAILKFGSTNLHRRTFLKNLASWGQNEAYNTWKNGRSGN